MFNFLRRGEPTVGTISPREAIARQKNGGIVLIDVRDGSEVAVSGMAKGALHIPLSILAMKCDPRSGECPAELQNGKPIVIYCASGMRSQRGAEALAGLGYEQVFNMGGFAGWVAAGGAISR